MAFSGGFLVISSRKCFWEKYSRTFQTENFSRKHLRLVSYEFNMIRFKGEDWRLNCGPLELPSWNPRRLFLDLIVVPKILSQTIKCFSNLTSNLEVRDFGISRVQNLDHLPKASSLQIKGTLF